MLPMPAASISPGSTPAAAQASRRHDSTASVTAMPVGPLGVSAR